MSDLPTIVISTEDYNRIHAWIERVSEKTEAIEALEDELERAEVVEPDKLPEDVVRMNSRVRFLNEQTNREYTVVLVFPDSVDGSTEKVSIFSPAGSAMIGLQVGDSISWPLSSRNTLRMKLMEVLS